MASHTRVLNVTRNFRMKFRQAEKAVENCACQWEEYGVAVRDLTVAEAIAARNRQATEQQRNVMPDAELPNRIFRYSKRPRDERKLVRRANVLGYLSNEPAACAVVLQALEA
jgi:hypothetical protein